MWIGDVGQDDVEEVDRVLLELDEPPKNLGWSAFEGTRRVEGHDARPRRRARVARRHLRARPGLLDHRRRESTAAARSPSLARRYVYGDFCTGSLWSLTGDARGPAPDVRREAATVPQLTHIGVDADGELVFASGAGAIYRAVPPAARAEARWPARRATRARDRPDARPGSRAGARARRTRSASSSCEQLVVAEERALHDDRLRAGGARGAVADADRLRAG